MSSPEYMRQVRVQSVGAGGVVDENGRHLIPIGRLPIKAGDTVWTDGRIIFGHVPIRQLASPVKFYKGVPFYDSTEGGYFNSVAARCRYKYPAVIISDGAVLINGERKLFLTTAKSVLLDVEILVDENEEEIGYVYAYADSIAFSSTDEIKNAQITIESSLGAHDVIQIADLECFDALADDVAKKCQADDRNDPSYTKLQLLYFRFTDKKGGWELYTGVNMNLTVLYYMPPEPEPDQYVTIKTLASRTKVGENNLMGQTIGYFREEFQTYSVLVEHPMSAGGYANRKIESIFGVVRVNSKGESVIVGRRYAAEATQYLRTIDWYVTEAEVTSGETASSPLADEAWPVGGYTVSNRTTFIVTETSSRVCGYFLPDGSDEPVVGSWTVGWMTDLRYERSVASQRPRSEMINRPAVTAIESTTVDLPDGYSMTLSKDYTKLQINKGNVALLDSYPMEPLPYLRYGWGFVKNNAPDEYWRFPHLSLYEFDLAKCVIVSEYMGKIRKFDSAGVTVVSEKNVNMRLRRMRRIKISG